ncbi:MAG: hypothetical protein FI723_12085 [SAR202 cluster bacterium]|nr:hypothetical protein [SAR202 cluster bacterium]
MVRCSRTRGAGGGAGTGSGAGAGSVATAVARAGAAAVAWGSSGVGSSGNSRDSTIYYTFPFTSRSGGLRPRVCRRTAA